MSHPTVQVFILTHNRPEMAIEAVNSVLKQDYPNLQVILSDNSTNDLTERKAMDIVSPKFTYRRRSPPTIAYTHFQRVFSEVTADYFLLFHDDDIMMDHAIEKYVQTMERFPNASALGANAYKMFDECKSEKTFLSRKQGFFKPSRINFIQRYLHLGEIAPYPSYFYRKNKVGTLIPSLKKGGKYADVSFLIDLYQKGEIVWIMEPLMYYRFHGSQDSGAYEYSDIRCLARYIESLNVLPKTSVSIPYFKAVQFYAFWKNCLAKGTAQKHHWAFFRVFCKLVCIRPVFFLPRILYCLLKSYGFAVSWAKSA